MAKIILSNGSDQRGSQGGTVFSKNRFGSYTRARVAPVQPRTPLQLNARTLFTTASRLWRSLTDAQRQVWNDAAAGVTIPDSMGRLYNPTGAQLRLRTAINGWLTTLATPPSITSAPYLPVQSPDAPTQMVLQSVAGMTPVHLSLTWSTPASASFAMLVFATPPLSPGVSFVRSSLFRLISSVVDSTVMQPLSLDAAYIAAFGAAPPIGSKVVVKVVSVMVGTTPPAYYPSPEGRAATIVTA